jgi:drug/metabolite transporter (DMT)-like permease
VDPNASGDAASVGIHFRHALSLFLLAGFCLSSLDTTAKYLVRDHALLIVVWARYAGQTLVVTPFAWHRAGRGFWRTSRLPMQLVRSSCLLAATICFFGGLRFLPLAEASSITFLAPVIVVAFSRPMLGERPTRPRVAAAVVGFIGILILLRPGSSILHPAVLLLLGAAFCNAFYQMLTRRLLDEVPHTTLFYSALVGTIVLSAALPWTIADTSFAAGDVLLLLLLGTLAGIGHWCLTHAYLAAPASLLTPFTYLQIVWATGFGLIVFGQHPDGWSAVGMVVIALSGLSLALHERRRVRVG